MTIPLEALANKHKGTFLRTACCWRFPTVKSCHDFFMEAKAQGYSVWGALDLAGLTIVGPDPDVVIIPHDLQAILDEYKAERLDEPSFIGWVCNSRDDAHMIQRKALELGYNMWVDAMTVGIKEYRT